MHAHLAQCTPPVAPPQVPWPCLCADWVDMRFIHYAFEPGLLASFVPLPLDVRDGTAHVSLVLFHLRRMHLAGTGPLGRACFRAVSDHPFLNVRTYVKGPAGPGILFLAEWISNPVSLRLGPALYGLPYRLARFRFDATRPGGTDHVRIAAPDGANIDVVMPSRPANLTTAAPGSDDEHLLERYTAYTHRNHTRWFHVAHEPWEFHRLDWVRVNTELVERSFPWFRYGKLAGAHASPGVRHVRMGFPQREMGSCPESLPGWGSEGADPSRCETGQG